MVLSLWILPRKHIRIQQWTQPQLRTVLVLFSKPLLFICSSFLFPSCIFLWLFIAASVWCIFLIMYIWVKISSFKKQKPRSSSYRVETFWAFPFHFGMSIDPVLAQCKLGRSHRWDFTGLVSNITTLLGDTSHSKLLDLLVSLGDPSTSALCLLHAPPYCDSFSDFTFFEDGSVWQFWPSIGQTLCRDSSVWVYLDLFICFPLDYIKVLGFSEKENHRANMLFWTH